jgi:hypothetical protein
MTPLARASFPLARLFLPAWVGNLAIGRSHD